MRILCQEEEAQLTLCYGSIGQLIASSLFFVLFFFFFVCSFLRVVVIGFLPKYKDKNNHHYTYYIRIRYHFDTRCNTSKDTLHSTSQAEHK